MCQSTLATPRPIFRVWAVACVAPQRAPQPPPPLLRCSTPPARSLPPSWAPSPREAHAGGRRHAAAQPPQRRGQRRSARVAGRLTLRGRLAAHARPWPRQPGPARVARWREQQLRSLPPHRCWRRCKPRRWTAARSARACCRRVSGSWRPASPMRSARRTWCASTSATAGRTKRAARHVPSWRARASDLAHARALLPAARRSRRASAASRGRLLRIAPRAGRGSGIGLPRFAFGARRAHGWARLAYLTPLRGAAARRFAAATCTPTRR